MLDHVAELLCYSQLLVTKYGRNRLGLDKTLGVTCLGK